MRTVPLPPFYFFGSRTLSYKIPNLKGNDVKLLQNLLNLLPDNIVRTKLKPDGIYNSITKKAVKEFQSYFNLLNTGKVEEETYFFLGHCVGKYAYNKPVFSSRIIKPNQEGSDVVILYNRLAAFKKGYLNRPATANYDEHLHKAVQNFQDNFPELKADGIVGPETFDYLLMWAPIGGRTLRIGRHGLDTYFYQLALKKIGYFSKQPDGFFDSYTDKKTRLFQKDAQIKVDGIVGPHTFLAIGTCQAFPDINYFYLVQSYDTIDKIAALFNKEVEDLIKINNLLAPNYQVRSGQLLIIPPPLTFHLIEKGETPAIIAQKYAILEQDFLKANSFIPCTSLLPDDMVVLPRTQLPLTGKIAYLNTNSPHTSLQIINLATLKNQALLNLENDTNKCLNYSGNRTLSFVSNLGKMLNKFNIETTILKSIPLSRKVTPCGDSIFINDNNDVIVEVDESITILPIKSKIAQWFEYSNKILYANNSYLKVYDLNTRVDKEVFGTKSNSICLIRFNSDKQKVLLILNNTPGTSTVSRLLDLVTKEAKEIGKDNYFAEWTISSNYLLLAEKKYYGHYFPWFYSEVKQYNVDGNLAGMELYTKGIDLSANLLSADDKFMAFIMFTPHAYFPIKTFFKDIFIKQINTRLVSRITYGEKAHNPNWL